MPMNQTVEPVDSRSALPRWSWAALNLLQFVFTLVWTMACVSVALVVYALSGRRRRVPLRMASWLWAPGLLRAAGGRFDVEGLERVDWSQPYVLVANHQSVIDICALFRAVPVPLRFLLKQEMTRVPFVNCQKSSSAPPVQKAPQSLATSGMRWYPPHRTRKL